MELEAFKEKCSKRVCLRRTTYNAKTCSRDSKQESCYDRFVRKSERDKLKREEKIAGDPEKEFKRIVKERDGGRCQKGQYRDWETDRKSTRLNSSHITRSRMPSSA